jgi:hypothetical protein
MNDCICLMRAAAITPNAVIANASSTCSAKISRAIHGARVAGEAAGGDVDAGDRRAGRVVRGELAGGHRAIIRAKLRLRSLAEASASRIVVPV